MSESTLWKNLRRRGGEHSLFFERIEQRLAAGFPDVLYRQKHRARMLETVSGRIELKIAKGRDMIDLGVTAEQAVNMRTLTREGWPVFVLCEHVKYGLALFAVDVDEVMSDFHFPARSLTKKLDLSEYIHHAATWPEIFSALVGEL